LSNAGDDRIQTTPRKCRRCRRQSLFLSNRDKISTLAVLRSPPILLELPISSTSRARNIDIRFSILIFLTGGPLHQDAPHLVLRKSFVWDGSRSRWQPWPHCLLCRVPQIFESQYCTYQDVTIADRPAARCVRCVSPRLYASGIKMDVRVHMRMGENATGKVWL
jgi:hypothetical protein